MRGMSVVAAAVKPKPKPKANAKAAKAAPAKNKWVGGGDGFDESKWYGPDRVLYLPSGLLERSEVADYLDGSLAGDYGYDPLNLGQTPEQVEKYRAFELIHARWAMLGAFGALLPEALDAFSPGSIPGAVWWQTGAVQLADPSSPTAVQYLGSIPTLPLPTNAALTAAVFLVLEGFRSAGGGQQSLPPFFPNAPEGADALYPGGGFDPLGLADDPEAFAELKVKEIKNGRLAMVSFLAFGVQAAVTGEGPYANLRAHLSSPFNNNLLTVLGGDRNPSL